MECGIFLTYESQIFMPLIVCHDCKAKISDKLSVCLKCGNPHLRRVVDEIEDEGIISELRTRVDYQEDESRKSYLDNAEALKKRPYLTDKFSVIIALRFLFALFLLLVVLSIVVLAVPLLST